jgi:hypothetical protein
MDAIDRRSALRGILCVAVATGFSASSLPSTVEAMPVCTENLSSGVAVVKSAQDGA